MLPFAGQTVATLAPGASAGVKEGTEVKYFLTDHLGSVLATLSSIGTLISKQRYLPFGAQRTDINGPYASPTDYGYTGQRQLDTGMGGIMDYKARFYSPTINRFLQPDTLIASSFIPQTWNRYSYTHNNPINYTDPSGNFIETAFDIVSVGMGIADIAQNGLNWANGAALALDVAALSSRSK